MIFKRKRRYILVEASRGFDITDGQNWTDLKGELYRFLGEKQYMESNLFPLKQLDDKRFIVRVSRGAEKHAILALSFVKKIGPSEIGFYTLKTSGTIRSLITQPLSKSI